ncbi:unnamed protein product [Urochloa humidicola]
MSLSLSLCRRRGGDGGDRSKSRPGPWQWIITGSAGLVVAAAGLEARLRPGRPAVHLHRIARSGGQRRCTVHAHGSSPIPWTSRRWNLGGARRDLELEASCRSFSFPFLSPFSHLRVK